MAPTHRMLLMMVVLLLGTVAHAQYPGEEEELRRRYVDENTPGKVSLRLETTGQEQVVGVFNRGQKSTLCQTPCRLWVVPGPIQLYMSGSGVLPLSLSLTVGPNGLYVRVRSADGRKQKAGGALAVVGANVMML